MNYQMTIDRQTVNIRRYRTLGAANRERGRVMMHAADSRLPDGDGAEHLCGNWGNPPAKLALAFTNRIGRRLYEREQREHYRIEHAQHIADGETGRYAWCERCS